MVFNSTFNPLNAELNPIYHRLALLGAQHIFHVSGLRVNGLNVGNACRMAKKYYCDAYCVTVCLFKFMGMFVTIQEQEVSYILCVIFRRCLHLYGAVGGANLKSSCRRRRRRADVLSYCLIIGTKENPGCCLNRNRH